MKGNLFENKYSVVIIALFCMVLWGSAFPVLKISYQELGIATSDYNSKIFLAGLRFFFAGILGFLYAGILLRGKIRIGRENMIFVILLGIIQTTLQYFFFYIGVGNTSGIKSAILQSASTFFVVILAHYLTRNDRLNVRKAISLVLGFTGIIIANFSLEFDLNFHWSGEGFLLLAALAGSYATIMVKNASNRMHPLVLSSSQMLLGALPLILIGLTGKPTTLQFTPLAWGLLFYGSFLSATAFSLWYGLLKYQKAGEISIYKLFIPIFGSLLSAIFIPGENFQIHLLIGLIFVVMGTFQLYRGEQNLVTEEGRVQYDKTYPY